MQLIAPQLLYDSGLPLYLQLYQYLKDCILSGSILPGERLPSLRNLSGQLGLSVTTINQTYSQLLMEGYIDSKPNSGYYVNSIEWNSGGKREQNSASGAESLPHMTLQRDSLAYLDESALKSHYFDPACFDFVKWKKCFTHVLNEYSDYLLVEADPRGEAPLRYEISKYIYQARGVKCTPQQIVIGAGTQQLTGLLCILLNRMGIEYAAFEEPGYLPVRSIFKNHGFKMTSIPVARDGIGIEQLPANIRSTVYVSPANQFPTGSIMPVARRYELLDWASRNESIIIEDDYNSELRYFGKAVPSLQGLDEKGQVVYLGSFSSTLFPSIKISYMVLPPAMLLLFEELLGAYTQTCSKTEQLTLALYMERGLFQTNIKKLRNLYSQKMQAATALFGRLLEDEVEVLNNTSGLHMLLSVRLPKEKSAADLCREAADLRLAMVPVPYGVSADSHSNNDKEESSLPIEPIIFYYTRVPLVDMEKAVTDFAALLRPLY